MKKINIKPQILYWTTIVIFIAIILFFTTIYPQTMDELRFSHDTWPLVFKQLKITFLTDSPRLATAINIILSHYPVSWKILFSVLNPFVQLFIILGIFFVITGRKINFKSKEDFYPFLLLILMYLLVIPCPSNTLIWLSGAVVYSWGFVPPLILLCLFRKSIDGKELKDSALNNFLMTLCGFAAGMSNENTGPMMLGLTVLFLIYCKFKKIKIPKFYYFALISIVLGLGAMFGSGAGISRARQSFFLTEWANFPLLDKFFIFIGQYSKLLNATFWLPIVNLIGLLLILYDRKKSIIKDKNFILSSLFCACAFMLALAFCVVPNARMRVFYSSAIFFFISFIMMLLIIKRIYSVNFIKYFALLFLIMGIIAGPFIAISHISLYQQDKYRRSFVKENRRNSEEVFFVPRLIVFKELSLNWTPHYYDILWPNYEWKLKKIFGGKISFEIDLYEYLQNFPGSFQKKQTEEKK